MKKTVCLVLTALMLFGSLAACKGDEIKPDETTTDTVDISAEVGSLAEYTLIRAEEASSAVKNVVAALRTGVTEKYSLNLKVDTDWLRPGQEADPTKKEILVGPTNRPETAEVMQSLNFGSYAIRHVGNKIVIAAHTAENLKLAVECFLTQTTSAENGTVSLKHEFTSESAPDFFTAENPLSGYTVAYNEGDKAVSATVKAFIDRVKSLCGITLPTSHAFFGTPAENEILIGYSGRDELDSSLDEFSYNIRTSGKKLVISAADIVGLAAALDALNAKFLSGDCSNIFNLPADTNISGSALGVTLPGGEDPARAEGTNLRIMSYNLLCELWNDHLPVEGRDALVGAILHSYQPDVAGLQEISANWYSALKNILGTRYKMTNGKIPGGEDNFNVIIYNPETVEMLEEGVFIYETGNSARLRNLTWARFRRLSDGAEFIVTNTHWDSTASLRPAQAPQNASLVLDLAAKYNCPIITTGDMNEHENGELLPLYLEQTGFQNAKASAEIVNRKCKTTHAVGSAPKSGSSIDNITASRDVTIKYYNILVCNAAINASDHVPIYADLILNKK